MNFSTQLRTFAVVIVAALGLLPLSSPVIAGTYDDMLAAMKTGSAPDVRAILERGLDPNTVDREGYTLLMLAIRDGHADIVDVLLAAKANPNVRNLHGDTALRLAAFKGDLATVQKLVKARAMINTPGWTPLIYAAFNGHAPVVQFLLDHGADVDAQADNGFTALIAASRGGYEDIVVALLKRKANPNLLSDKGLSAMDYAQATSNTDIYERLRAAGGQKGAAIVAAQGKP